MKRFGLTVVASVAILGMGWLGLAAGPAERDVAPEERAEPPMEPVELFMRTKLRHAQRALEGVVTEDFDRIRLAAEEMQAMSRVAEWAVIEGPQYRRHSLEFRRAAEELAEAAQEQNGDAAALAYLRVTLSCVQCHKHVRSVRVADLEHGLPGEEVGRLLFRAAPQE